MVRMSTVRQAASGAVARMLRVRSMVVLMCSSFSRGIRWIPRGGRTTAYEVGRGRTWNPDSLRRCEPDQVRGSAVARTLSAGALPCR